MVVLTCGFEDGVVQNFIRLSQGARAELPAGIAPEAEVKKYLGWDDKRDGVLMIPHMVFLDAKGVIRGDFDGKDGFYSNMDENIRKQLDKLTKPAGARPRRPRRKIIDSPGTGQEACPSSIPLLYPVLVQPRVLDRLALRHEVAVSHVDRAVLCLDHATG